MTAGCQNVGLRVMYYLVLGLSHPATVIISIVIIIIIITIILIIQPSENEKHDLSERTSKRYKEARIFKPTLYEIV